MTQRINYPQLSSGLYKKFIEFSMAFKDSTLDPKLHDLINIRVSQINGCAFCLDMHIKEAKIHGTGELKLHHIAIWHESPLFDARERAALEWAETVTRLPSHGIPDEAYSRVREQFSEQEVSDLVFAIAAINAWNRISISSAAVPGSQDVAYGLTKARFADAA